jgi:hypothetical protein
MTAFNPSWRTDTAAAARQWSRFSDDPLNFVIYPKAPSNQTLSVRYTRAPTTLALSDSITELPVALEGALVDYTVYRAESKDDEYTLSARAKSHYDSFLDKVRGHPT